MLRESGDLDGEPKATQRMANFYEKGDKPLEIVATRQWYIKNGGKDAALRKEMLVRGGGDHLDPHPHEAPLRQLGRRPQRRLADLAPAVLRHPVPGLVPPRRRRRARPRPPADAERGPAAGRPVDAGARRLHRGPAGQARRLHRRPRRDGHVGDVLADPADRGHVGGRRRPVLPGLPLRPRHPGARHHPHLAVLARRPRRLRERRRPVVARDDLRLHRRPRPQEDVEVQGQRRRPDRHPRQVRRRRRPLARRHRPSRHGLPLRRVADEGRPTAGDEGPQRLEVRPRQRRRHRAQPGRRQRPGRLRPAGPARGRRPPGDRGLRRLRLHDRARGHREVLLGVLRRLPRAGQGARVRRRGRRRHRLRARHAGHRAARPAPAARTVPALRHRGGLVVVAGRLHPPRLVAHRRRPRLGCCLAARWSSTRWPLR